MHVVINLSKFFPFVGNEMNSKSTMYGMKIQRGLTGKFVIANTKLMLGQSRGFSLLRFYSVLPKALVFCLDSGEEGKLLACLSLMVV